ncbi:hypothetical protein T492DRAFT_878162 [Pavlovales sp. CCMP2436]|nr:hypothetical protein T492DRAFT_878162 [Pavlovales sp. CCMP2436]
MLLPAAAAVCALGAAARGGGPHAETPLKATKATTTMLLPASAAVAAAAEARPRWGVELSMASGFLAGKRLLGEQPRLER